MLDDHHGGIGHVDSDLDHRGGHQNVHLAIPEAAHHPVTVFGLHPAMNQVDLQIGPAGGQSLYHGGGSTEISPLGLLDHRQHHIRLSSFQALGPDKIEDSLPLI